MGIAREIKTIREQYQFVEKNKPSNIGSKLALQSIIAFSFFVLSVANIATNSHYMIVLTSFGFAINMIFVILSKKMKSGKLSSYTSTLTCSLLFTAFVICGGNDGFACLWIVLLPPLSMIIMDFKFGFYTSVFLQVFLIVMFWTPMKENLLYDYNEQFCLRFPLFYFVTFMLGLLLTVSLQRSEYNEYMRLIELEELNEKAIVLSRTDHLTQLSNRRYAYEELNSNFADCGVQHCIVMADIDNFKQVNDLYGHEFGDEVLITISKYITEILPNDYLKSRWGGEEFLFAANESPKNVYERVEQLRKTVSAHSFSFNSANINITMTFGIAMYTNIEDVHNAINLADKRLYIGKSKNKNCTVAEE